MAPYDDLVHRHYADDQESPDIYTIFGQVIAPVLFRPLMDQQAADEDRLGRFYALVEQLLARGDAKVRECVSIEVVEHLVIRPDWAERAEPWLVPLSVPEHQRWLVEYKVTAERASGRSQTTDEDGND